MPATEIPPQRPLPPPPESSDLYDAQRWEHVYREMHNVPELLVQLQDDLSAARKREAFWISVIAHIVLAIIVVNSPRFDRFFPQRQVVFKPTDQKDLHFLELPPDSQHVTKKPDTNIISDKDRIASSKTPQLDHKELKKILDSARAGAPGVSAPPAPQQQPQQAEAQPQPQGAPPQEQQTQPQPDTNQNASLHMPQQAAPPRPSFGSGSMSAGSAIEQAARASLGRGPRYGDSGGGGDNGLSQGRSGAKAASNLEVLSDTMGVDFGPYLQRVIRDVKNNWYNLIPESARPPLMKKGKVSIRFAIMKNGTVPSMILEGPSGDVSLDRAAWGGITNSTPFSTLPTDFRGDYLMLRFNFYYNPDSSDLQ